MIETPMGPIPWTLAVAGWLLAMAWIATRKRPPGPRDW